MLLRHLAESWSIGVDVLRRVREAVEKFRYVIDKGRCRQMGGARQAAHSIEPFGDKAFPMVTKKSGQRQQV
jgi:NADH:ubiquinone oxidoreductase subunit B-like Fe-S oxidoreductase